MRHIPVILRPCPTSGGTSRTSQRQCGFSLIELMIAITLGLLILAGILAIFVNTSATRNEIDRNNRQIENGRYAMDLLRDDIQLAGFFGEIDVAALPAAPSIEPPPDPCSATLLESTDPKGDSGILRLHLQGVNNYDSGAAAPDNLKCINDANPIMPKTDVLVVRRVKTCFAGPASCELLTKGKPYVQISFCASPTTPSTSTIKTHALAFYPNDAEFVHQLNSSAGVACTVAAPLRPYVIYLYFVGTDNILKRAEWVDGVGMSNVTSLVDGIEQLQLEYGVDTNNDGNPDTYVASPTLAQWPDVVTVQIYLLTRNTEPSPGYTDTKTYSLGTLFGNAGPYGDSFRRHAYSSRVRIQNVSGRRETP